MDAKAEEAEGQYPQLRARIWKTVEEQISFKGLKLLSWRHGEACFSRHRAWRSRTLAHPWRRLFPRAAGGELSLRVLGRLDGAATSQWSWGYMEDVGLPWSSYRSYLIRKLHSGNLFILNHRLLLCTGSTLFQRALDVFSVIAFWKRIFGRSCQGCDAVLQACDTTSFLLPPLLCFLLLLFAWQHAELSTSSCCSWKRFQLIPFSQSIKPRARPEGWVL